AFGRSQTLLLGTNRTALEAAKSEAERRGYTVILSDAPVTGEAREVGAALVQRALRADAAAPFCLLHGGETTVTVAGKGRGGRNQEVALGAALDLDGTERPLLILSGATDGIDGPTDAAGAWATPATVKQAQHLGMNASAYLKNNVAYPFFERLGALLQPGPTHTNVMDVLIVL